MPYIILLLFVLIGCSLNADQERFLSEAQRAYVEARNEADVLKYVGYTHPSVIAYYKNDEDSAFQNKFDLSSQSFTIQDGSIRFIKTKGSSIHVDYIFKTVEKGSFGEFGEDIHIMAISEDNGKTWFFLDEMDYRNEQIIALEHQLIEPNE